MLEPSYERPQRPSWDIPTVKPRPFEPLLPLPSGYKRRPQLPSPPRPVDSLKGFTVTTHLVPAAFPRRPYAPAPHMPTSLPGETKAQRIARLQQVGAEQLARRAAYEVDGLAPPPSRQEVLWLAVNRYAPTNVAGDGRGVTLVFTHGNGMHKETWEPTLRHLLELGAPIAEAWTLDCANQGDSGLVNVEVLPEIFDVAENARDSLNFLLYYMPSASTSKSLPVHLARVSDEEIARRQTSGYQARTLCAVVHSLGACLSFGAVYCPHLFSSVVIVEPVMIPPPWLPNFGHTERVMNTMVRRTSWPSREEAFAALRRSPFFRSWDEEVLRAYVQYAMTFSPEHGAQLKTSVYQEASIFAETRVPHEGWESIKDVPGEIELFWVMSGSDNTLSGGDPYSAQTVWRRPANCSNVRLANVGHLIPQQAPRKLAEVLHIFLVTKYARAAHGSTPWRRTERALL